MYKRFYLGCEDRLSNNAKKGNEKHFVMHIIDNLDGSNEFLIKDFFGVYRLTRTDGSYNYTYQDTHVPSLKFSGFSDPLTLMSIALIRAISRLLDQYDLIHAGAVSRNGDGIIFPAQANMGKTTLVLKLLHMGFRFLSDEIACLNPDTNRLEPFPRAVNIREESRNLLGLTMRHGSAEALHLPSELVHTFDIEELAAGSLSRPSEPRYLIFLKGFGEKPGLEYVAPSHALFSLIQFVLSTNQEPSSLLLRLAPAVDKLQCFNLVMGDIAATADLIRNVVDETAFTGRTATHAS